MFSTSGSSPSCCSSTIMDLDAFGERDRSVSVQFDGVLLDRGAEDTNGMAHDWIERVLLYPVFAHRGVALGALGLAEEEAILGHACTATAFKL